MLFIGGIFFFLTHEVAHLLVAQMDRNKFLKIAAQKKITTKTK